MKRLLVIAIVFVVFFASPAQAHDPRGVYWMLQDNPEDGIEAALGVDDQVDAELVRALQSAGTDPDDAARLRTTIAEFGNTGTGAPEGVFLASTRWAQYSTLVVCFFDGDEKAQEHVMELFDELIEHTNLKIGRTVQKCPVWPVDMQIKFDMPGCSAFIGRLGKKKISQDRNAVTIALCGQDGPTWSRVADGAIRHELMHALGAVHEHQHPQSPCAEELSLEGILADAPVNLSNEEKLQWLRVNYQVVTNLAYKNEEIFVTQYDADSIMHYRISDPLYFKAGTVNNQRCALRRTNNELSQGDKQILALMYPK